MAITVTQHGEFVQVNDYRLRIRDIVSYNTSSNESYGGRGRYTLKILYKQTGDKVYQDNVPGDNTNDLNQAAAALDAIMKSIAQPNPQ